MDTQALERLLKHVEPSGLPPKEMCLPCWDWIGDVDPKGRPRFFWKGCGGLAKKALIEILYDKPIPEGCVIMSLCGNAGCLRPEHLFLCNETDAYALGPHGDLDQGRMLYIRNLHGEGYDEDELAMMFEISLPLVNAILAEGHRSTLSKN